MDPTDYPHLSSTTQPFNIQHHGNGSFFVVISCWDCHAGDFSLYVEEHFFVAISAAFVLRCAYDTLEDAK